jgi:hypothetical protein
MEEILNYLTDFAVTGIKPATVGARRHVAHPTTFRYARIEHPGLQLAKPHVISGMNRPSRMQSPAQLSITARRRMGDSRGIAPRILNVSTRWMPVVSFTLRPLCPW